MIALLFIAAVILTASGQLLLKVGAGQRGSGTAVNRFVLAGYLVFGLTVIIVYFLMQEVELKYVSALMGANYIAVAICSACILKEPLDGRRMAGTVVIAVGVVLFVLG